MYDYFSFKKKAQKRVRDDSKATPFIKHSKKRDWKDSSSNAETELSDSTQELIDSLNLSATPRSSLEAEDILNSVPVKERFIDLLDPQRSLRLPLKYKNLLRLFKVFDLFLHYAQFSQIPATFSNIKAAVDDRKQCNLTLKEVRQFLQIFPEAFAVNWRQKKHSTQHELIFELLGNSSKSHRKIEFRNRLLDITKQQHCLLYTSPSPRDS